MFENIVDSEKLMITKTRGPRHILVVNAMLEKLNTGIERVRNQTLRR